MIIDSETNQLYLSGLLKRDYPNFFKNFTDVLATEKIIPVLLKNTKDIWCRDFMPVQVNRDINDDKFVQFVYEPDYLLEYPNLKSIPDKICETIDIKTVSSKLIVDGGNVVHLKDKVIMCDKVFHENRKISEKEIIRQLKEVFQVDNLYFVPWDTDDFTGHADGIVRFIDDDTVLINEFTKENREYEISLRMALYNAGLKWEELPYNPPIDPTFVSARGLYLNYLQMNQVIIMPTFNSTFDDKALNKLQEVFKGQTIKTVESIEIAREGGVLNCISWNIKK